MKRFLIIFLIIELTFSWGSFNKAYSQADAGEDKFYVPGETGPEIGGKGGIGGSTWCYSWEPKTGLSDFHSPNPIATPAVTTTYKLTVVGQDFSFTSVDEVTVNVVNKMKLEVENNITECMENRQLTFTSSIDGTIPATSTDLINYKFHFKRSDGAEFYDNVWSLNKIQTNTMTTDTVLTGDADHKYKLSVYAEAQFKDLKLISDTINIDVYELWIFSIEYGTLRPWKAVIGEPFKYSAIASSDCKNWKWEMSDGTTSWWKPTGGDKRSGELTIPYSNLTSAKNSYFGDTLGIVTVSCEDSEGNKYSFKSTDMTNPQKVKVFFDPDLNKDGGAPSTSMPPCWFIFWKDGKVVEDIDKCQYNHTLGYGAYDPSSRTLELGPFAASENNGPETLTDMDGNTFTMTGQGKHLYCLAETMSHEFHHKFINDSLSILFPQSDDDKLPDWEEQFPTKSYFKRSDPNDNNTFKYADYANTNYADAEVRGRIIEISPGLKKIFPALDWSKDPENPKW